MRAKIIVVAALAGSLLGMSSVPASADEIGPSPAFGVHVSDMAPQHPLESGTLFAECVSTMARGEDCPHH